MASQRASEKTFALEFSGGIYGTIHNTVNYLGPKKLAAIEG